MQPDNIAIEFPSLDVERVEEAARHLLDRVQLLWDAGRLRGLMASNEGHRAFQGFLAAVAEVMTQTYEASRDGATQTPLRIRLPRGSATDIIALAWTVVKLAEREETMRSVGGSALTPQDAAFIREHIRLAQSAVGAGQP